MKKLLFLVPILAGAIWFGSCSKTSTASGGTAVSGTAGAYQGAGSRWVATFTTTSFVIQKFPNLTSTTADLTVNGSYIQFASGFKKLTVVTASGSGAPTAGTQAYGFDIPGFAFILKPIGSNSEPIVMLSSGSCPTGAFNANWIKAKFDAGETINNTDDTFGTASFNMTTPATSVATINKLSAETASSLGTNVVNFDYTTCANANLTFTIPASSPVENVDMIFTAAGGALVHSFNNASHDSIIFAAPKHTADATQAEIAGTYSVLVFDHSSSGEKMFPAKLVIPTTGNGTANKITDVETDVLSADPAIPISGFTAVTGSNGLFSLALDPTGQNGRISCAYFSYTGTKVMSCNGYGSAGGGRQPFFFLARSR